MYGKLIKVFCVNKGTCFFQPDKLCLMNEDEHGMLHITLINGDVLTVQDELSEVVRQLKDEGIYQCSIQ